MRMNKTDFPADSGKKRPVVAFFNGNIHDIHSRTLLDLIYKDMKEEEVDFHYYMGADLSDFMDSGVPAFLRAADHYYSLFSYSVFDTPDLIIISMGALTNADNSVSAADFISRFSPIPVILLENDTDLPEVYHILIDNYGGIYEIVKHLVRVHACRHIVHLAGPAKNNDAVLRKKAFRDALRDNGLAEGMILHGDYTRNVDEQIEKLLDMSPDAIVAANDVMAGRCLQLARRRGLQPGRDILITGFDDMPMAAFMDPPLTTVRQNYPAIASSVVRRVHEFLQGEPLADETISVELVCRESCGCAEQEDAGGMAGKHLLAHHEQIDRMVLQTMESAVALRSMLIQEMDVEKVFRALGNTLRRLGAVRSFILLYEKPLKRCRREVVQAPEGIQLMLSQEGESVHSYDFQNAPVLKRGGLRAYVRTDERTYFTDFVLFYQKYEYGVMSVEIPPDRLLFFYSLSLEIGSGLRYLQISRDRHKVRTHLEEKNQILEYVASHDTLTGLYNRAGIMNEIFSYVRSFPEGERFLLVMADLDHLKQINDTFGHNEGDEALKKVSTILHDVFPAGSPIGRNGGDEFIGVMHLESPEMKEAFLSGIREECAAADRTNGKPYYIEISAGVQEFDVTDLVSMRQIIEKADQMLYEAKEKRRRNVVKQL